MVKRHLAQVDPGFGAELRRQPGAERIAACFMCRTCTASCPITAVEHRFNPFRIIRMALLGLRDEVLGSKFIWLCSNCYACQERCPQGVGVTEFMVLLRNMAVKAGRMPPGVQTQMDLVRQQGRIYAIDEFDNKKRRKLDLPPLPTSCDIVQKLFPEEREA